MAFRHGLMLGCLFVAVSTAAAPCQMSDDSDDSDASVATSLMAGASKRVDVVCDSGAPADGKTLVELLQTRAVKFNGSVPGGSDEMFPTIPTLTTEWHIQNILRIAAGILLLCFLLALKFASTEMLVSMAAFLDHFMISAVYPMAPTVTPNYELIAVLQNSRNLVACLLVPFGGKFIDGHEAKSMQLGMLCAVLCSLGFALEKDYGLWLAMRCLSGCSTAGVLWGGFALLNQVHANDAAARMRAMSLAMSGLYAGLITGPQLGGLFVDDSRFIFLLLAGVQMCMCLTLRVRLSDLSQLQKPIQEHTEPVPKVDMLELVLDPKIGLPTVALCLSLTLQSALTATTFEYMTSLGYDHVKQNLTWLMATIPAIVCVKLVPVLRSVVAGQRLQMSALLLGGSSALACFGSDYIFLALTLIGSSAAAGILNGNTPAMLADRSQEKYHGTGKVLILPNTADQVACIFGPYAGGFVCRYANFQAMCHVIGGCLVLCAIVLLLWTCVRQDERLESEAKQQTSTRTGTEPCAPYEASMDSQS